MIDDKKLKEVENRVKIYLRERKILSKSKPEFKDFFVKNADDSLESAKILFEISTDTKKQELLGLTSFNG